MAFSSSLAISDAIFFLHSVRNVSLCVLYFLVISLGGLSILRMSNSLFFIWMLK